MEGIVNQKLPKHEAKECLSRSGIQPRTEALPSSSHQLYWYLDWLRCGLNHRIECLLIVSQVGHSYFSQYAGGRSSLVMCNHPLGIFVSQASILIESFSADF